MIDTHCHLDFPQFDSDREVVLAKAFSLGVKKIVVPGTDVSQWAKLCELAEKNTKQMKLGFCPGVHPWWIEKQEVESKTEFAKLSEQFEQHLQNFIYHSACVGIGETGLDATIKTQKEKQKKWLNLHLSNCKNFDRPIVLHSVKAHNEMIRILKQWPEVNGVIHAFSGSYEMAMEYWSMGYYLGIGGTITYERASKTRDAISRMPLDALVLETDAPDMPLFDRQGQRNSPEILPDILAELSGLRNEESTHVSQVLEKNTLKLFPRLSADSVR